MLAEAANRPVVTGPQAVLQRIGGGGGVPRRVVTLSLAEGDVAVLDRLARAYGSRSRAVRELLRQAACAGVQDGPMMEELRRLSCEVAALRGLVEQLQYPGRAETAVATPALDQAAPVESAPVPETSAAEKELDDDHKVRKVIDALLSMSRTAKG